MNPTERELIQSVLDRLARVAGSPKDPEAEALITEGTRRLPDSGYNLVQAVVVQELGLKQAESRIAELERQLAEARAAAPQAQPQAGGFLGGGNPWGRGSVPPVPPQQTQPAYAPPAQQQYAPQQYAAPAAAAPSPWGQSAGGGFLRSAATTAAGVAGGVLLAEGLSSLFSGHHGGGGFGSPWGGGGMAGPVSENVTVNNYYGDGAPESAQQGFSGSPSQVSYDTDVSDDGGGFDGGGDSDF